MEQAASPKSSRRRPLISFGHLREAQAEVGRARLGGRRRRSSRSSPSFFSASLLLQSPSHSSSHSRQSQGWQCSFASTIGTRAISASPTGARATFASPAGGGRGGAQLGREGDSRGDAGTSLVIIVVVCGRGFSGGVISGWLVRRRRRGMVGEGAASSATIASSGCGCVGGEERWRGDI